MKKLRRLKNWSAKRAHSFAMSRIGKIELFLEEIAFAYADVDQAIDDECTRIRDEVLPGLSRSLDEALAEGRTIYE